MHAPRFRGRVSGDGRRVLFVVEDDGRGISAEFLPYVFELFSQGDVGLARTEGGLGIGLTLVKNLVEQHGGEVTAESPGPGMGSRFTVALPLSAPQLGAPAQPLGGAGVHLDHEGRQGRRSDTSPV